MKATIERATLLHSLSHVQSVVERRNTIPILSNVLIEASADGNVRLMATDLDLQVVEVMPAASVEGAGAITVSAHLLFDIARKLPDGAHRCSNGFSDEEGEHWEQGQGFEPSREPKHEGTLRFPGVPPVRLRGFPT